MIAALGLGVLGQINLKYGMQKYGALGAPGLALVSRVFSAMVTPQVLLGLVFYAVSACLWLVVISPEGWALSYAYPMLAFNYVAVVLLSRALFGETVTSPQWVGIGLMCVGLVLVARYGAATGAMP